MAGEFEWAKDLGAGVGATAYDVFLILILLIIVGGAAWFVLWYMSYKHEVIIRYMTKNRKFVIKDKAKIIVEDGTKLWRLLRMKETVAPPPPEAIEITKRGKFFAECYWSEDNPSPVWLEDSDTPDKAFLNQAFTSDERSFHVARGRRAMERKKTSGWDKFMQIAMPAAMIIIVSIPFIFWGNLVSESTKMAEANTATATQINKNLESVNQITSNMARITETEGIEIEQVIPEEKVPS